MSVLTIAGIVFGVQKTTASFVIFMLVVLNLIATGSIYVLAYRKKIMKLWKILILGSVHLVVTILATAISVLAIYIILSVSGVKVYTIMGFSMVPNYEHNTSVLTSSVHDPQRDDVIIATLRGEEGYIHEFMSRAVGVPGDTVIVSGDDVFVNNVVVKKYPRDQWFKERADGLGNEPRQEIVLITSRGIIPAIEELQDRLNESGYLPDVLQGDPVEIAIEYGWFRALDNLRHIDAAESLLALPGSFISYNNQTIVDYVGFRENWGGWSFPYDFINEETLTITDPLQEIEPTSVVVYMDTDGGGVSFEKIDQYTVGQQAIVFTLGEDEYFIINDQRFSFINNSPWHVVSPDDIKGVVFSKFNLFR